MLNKAKKQPSDGAYLDHAASTPVDPRVVQAMTTALEAPGNPSSVHAMGRAARVAVDDARERLSALLGVRPSELTFTSGATEANVHGMVGLYRAAVAGRGDGPFRVLASPIEHTSVNAALEMLAAEEGAIIERLGVGRDGRVRTAEVAAALRGDTVLVCVMRANNVFGAIQPIADIAGVVAVERASRGTNGVPLLLFSDAVQALRTEDVRPREEGADAMSFSAHKAYGPKGVGALWIREGVGFAPRIVGGGQESGRRAGTENVPGIVGFGRAADLLSSERATDRARAMELRERLLAGFAAAGIMADVVGDAAGSLPGIVYLSLGRLDGDVTALKLDSAGVFVSSGSACDSGKRGTSSALAAVRGGGANGIRISFGRGTTEADIDAAIAALAAELG